MNAPTPPPEFELLNFEALSNDVEAAAKQNKLNSLLNNPPKQEWLRQNAMANNTLYIPIGIVEYLLTAIFQEWKVEVKEVKQVANSVLVSVRLHVKNPLTGEWSWQDGIGASPLQTDKGSHASNMAAIKSSAVQMAAPAAESYAVKDAAEKLGKIFGKDLNRKDEPNYDDLKEKFTDRKKEGMEKMRACKTPAEFKKVVMELGTLVSDPDVVELGKSLKLNLQ